MWFSCTYLHNKYVCTNEWAIKVARNSSKISYSSILQKFENLTKNVHSNPATHIPRTDALIYDVSQLAANSQLLLWFPAF